MISTTKEYRDIMHQGNRVFDGKATITLADSTVLKVDKERIVDKGIKISDRVAEMAAFSIGTAAINQCELILDNRDESLNMIYQRNPPPANRP